MNAERPSDRASSRTAPYDFQRLERCVEELLEDHARVNAEREALLDELVEREQRIAALEARLASAGDQRSSAVDSVDRILKRVDQIERFVAEVSPSSGSGGR